MGHRVGAMGDRVSPLQCQGPDQHQPEPCPQVREGSEAQGPRSGVGGRTQAPDPWPGSWSGLGADQMQAEGT